MDTTENTLNVLSLCPGIRGIERGIERAIEGSGYKLKTVAYAEIESFIITNLVAGMEAGILDPAPIWTDLKTFPYQSFHGKIHGIIGGYPCQPFSNAGKREGENDPRHLWPYIANGIRAVRPLWCFFENVSGHLTLGYETVRGELQEMGYHVEEGIFSAEEVGAPHRRERLFILAVLANSDSFFGGLSESTKWGNNTETAGTGKTKLDDTRLLRQKIDEKQTTRIEQSSKAELADTKSQFCKLSGYTWKWRSRFTNSSIVELANSNNEGFQGWKCGELCECTGKCTPRTSSAFTGWPAGIGKEQYEWEESRVVKSGMGCTINGYNFREDLLRAIGNGVVEQTAELAWNILWEKMENEKTLD